MTRHSSPHNQVSVPVLDRNGSPLTPTRPSRARKMLEQGRAVRCRRHGRFAVRILDRSRENSAVPKMTLGIDPGTRVTGMAVSIRNPKGTKVIHGAEILHRGHRISQAMSARRSHRRNRRSRLRTDGEARGYATLEGGKTRVRAEGRKSVRLREATLPGERERVPVRIRPEPRAEEEIKTEKSQDARPKAQEEGIKTISEQGPACAHR